MIRHIVAIDNKRGIAKDGVQPWSLPSDEQYFTDMTKSRGGTVLMGAKTYQVTGHALVGRQNFVASRNSAFKAPGAVVITDVDAFLRTQDDIWVMGGALIYEYTLFQADELYITQIDADFDCDVFYPDFAEDFSLTQQGNKQSENGLIFRYNIYSRNR